MDVVYNLCYPAGEWTSTTNTYTTQASSFQHHIPVLYTPFTQELRPFCLPCVTEKLPRSLLKAQRRPKGCLGHSRVVHRMFRRRHGHREVLKMLKKSCIKVAEEVVRSQEVGGRHMHRHIVHWSPHKKLHTVVNIVFQFEWCFCLP